MLECWGTDLQHSGQMINGQGGVEVLFYYTSFYQYTLERDSMGFICVRTVLWFHEMWYMYLSDGEQIQWFLSLESIIKMLPNCH